MPSFIEHLSHTTRSYRRFRSIYRVPEGHMKKWVDNTRYTASAVSYTHLDVYKRQASWAKALGSSA